VQAGAEGGEEGGLGHGGSRERRREEGREARRAAEGGWRLEEEECTPARYESETDWVRPVHPGPVQAQGQDCFFSDLVPVLFCILIDKEPPSPSSEAHCAYLLSLLSLPGLIRLEVEENRNSSVVPHSVVL
jgi:hypothetical protein